MSMKNGQRATSLIVFLSTIVGLSTNTLLHAAEKPPPCQPKLMLPCGSSEVIAVCFSPDDSKIASASVDGTVKIWDHATGVCIREVKLNGRANSVTYSPDGFAIAVGLMREPPPHEDGSRIELKERFGFILIDLKSEITKREFWAGGIYEGRSLVFSTDGKTIYAPKVDGLSRWDLDTGARTDIARKGMGYLATKVAANKFAMALHRQYQFAIYDLADQAFHEIPREDPRGANALSDLSLSQDGTLLVSGNVSGEVQVIETATGKVRSTFTRTPDGEMIGRVLAVHFLPNGKEIISAHVNGYSVTYWCVLDGSFLGSMELAPGAPPKGLEKSFPVVTSMVFSPSGKSLAAMRTFHWADLDEASPPWDVLIWDLPSLNDRRH